MFAALRHLAAKVVRARNGTSWALSDQASGTASGLSLPASTAGLARATSLIVGAAAVCAVSLLAALTGLAVQSALQIGLLVFLGKDIAQCGLVDAAGALLAVWLGSGLLQASEAAAATKLAVPVISQARGLGFPCPWVATAAAAVSSTEVREATARKRPLAQEADEAAGKEVAQFSSKRHRRCH